MSFKEELITQFKRGTKSIEVKDLLNSKTQLCLSINTINGKDISLNTILKETKIRFRPRYEEEGELKNMPFRLDNSHKKEEVHTHWEERDNKIHYPADHLLTIRDFFKYILGSDFKEEDFV